MTIEVWPDHERERGRIGVVHGGREERQTERKRKRWREIHARWSKRWRNRKRE